MPDNNTVEHVMKYTKTEDFRNNGFMFEARTNILYSMEEFRLYSLEREDPQPLFVIVRNRGPYILSTLTTMHDPVEAYTYFEDVCGYKPYKIAPR